MQAEGWKRRKPETSLQTLLSPVKILRLSKDDQASGSLEEAAVIGEGFNPDRLVLNKYKIRAATND